MSKPLQKKGSERGRKSRPAASSSSAKGRKRQKSPSQSRRQEAEAAAASELCYHCSRSLAKEEKALLVEEEVGRVFCTEECIASYFGPEIERLEKEYFRGLPSDDLSPEEREKYAHLRWITLEEPDEVWREKTLAGDYRYTLIAEFSPADQPIWCVAVCLFLRGEPSFLYLAFPTSSPRMVDRYRRGERVQWVRPKRDGQQSIQAEAGSAAPGGQGASRGMVDGLADAWTPDETLLAQLHQKRRSDDIPNSQYELYSGCLEGTLEEPDEVWSIRAGGEETPKLYHFIRHYPNESPGIWFVIVARETDDEEQIEILDAFPTRDPDLADSYRRGTQEVGQLEGPVPSRLVH